MPPMSNPLVAIGPGNKMMTKKCWHQWQKYCVFQILTVFIDNNVWKTKKEKCKKKRGRKNNVHSPQRAGCKSCSNTKHYVCAFVTRRAVIPRATNRKYPSERMKLEAVSRGCCGRIHWCRLAHLSQKAASAVEKTRWLVSPVCCESRDEWEPSGASHTESLAVSTFLAGLFFSLPAGFLCLFSHENVILHPPKKKGGGEDGGFATVVRVRVTQCVRRTPLLGWKGVVGNNSSSANHMVLTAFHDSFVSIECFYN